MTHKILFSIVFSAVLLTGCTTAHTSTPDIERKHYSEWEKDVGYTRVIRIGNTLHLAGLGGEGGTQAEQIDSVYQTISAILADYHATTSDIVKEVVYTIDIDELIAAQEIRKNILTTAVTRHLHGYK